MIDESRNGLDRDEYIIINAGNVFDFQSRASDISARYMLEGLSRTGVDVVGLGVYDLNGGVERLQELTEKSSVDIVCANIDGCMPFVRYIKGERKFKILVTSVVDPALSSKGELAIKGISDPVSALRRIQNMIKHDVFIVILHAFGENERAIISQVPGIDLVVNGTRLSVFDNIKQLSKTPVVYNNQRGGSFVAYVDLEVDPEKQGTAISKPVVLRAGVGQVVEDKGIVDLINSYESERRDFFEKLKKEGASMKQQYSNFGVYLGSRSCRYCHSEISHEWETSRHGKAIESLIAKKKEYDTDCLPCHVTGMNKHIIGGFTSMHVNPDMAGVQCEVCHGQGARHVQSRGKMRTKKVTEGTCRECHTIDTDPKFEYDKDRLLGTHKHYKNKN